MGVWVTYSRYLLLLSLFCLVFGCAEKKEATRSDALSEGDLENLEGTDLGIEVTVGDLAAAAVPPATELIGFGLVAGLPHTGSQECPPTLKTQLIKVMQQEMPERSGFDYAGFISSKETAVVQVTGLLPALANRGQRIDIQVSALANTQTTSLAGGHLFTVELKEKLRVSSFNQFSESLAQAEGPVFVSDWTEQRTAYILGGGEVLDDYPAQLRLRVPSYRNASAIRNRIIERFGSGTATAKSPEMLQLKVPENYNDRKTRFLRMVLRLHMLGDRQAQQNRIDRYVAQLEQDDKKYEAEISLCAIGRTALPALSPLLTHKDVSVRFHASRALLELNDFSALGALRQIVLDPTNPYRIEAIRAVGRVASRRDAAAILGRSLRSTDFEVRLAAYRQLSQAQDAAIHQTIVARDFSVDQVMVPGPAVIYAERSIHPRIVIFGAPLRTTGQVFATSASNGVTVNAMPQSDRISVMRKHPSRPRLIGPLESTRDVVDIIKALCEDPVVENNPLAVPGLGVPYSELLPLLEQMCNNGSIEAEFRQGPLPDLP